MWKRSFEERSIHRLDERVQAEVRLVVPAGDGERHLGERRAGRRHARLAEEGEGQDLAGLRRVERTALEMDRAEPVEIGMVGAVEIDLEGSLQAAGRRHVRGVAGVTKADALVRLALGRQRPARPGELDPEEVPLARPGTRLFRPRAVRRPSEAAGRGRRLHGLIFFGRDLDMDAHDLVQAKKISGRRRRIGIRRGTQRPRASDRPGA